MKKTVTSILSILLALGITACASSSSADNAGQKIDQPVSSTAEKGTGSTTSASAGPSVTSARTDAPPTAAAQAPSGQDQEASIKQQVLVDKKDIKITATGLELDGLFGASLKVLIENNSDTDLVVQTRGSSVNGYMIESLISADVAAGKKTNDEITFMSSSLEACGIKEIADLEFYFHIFTAEGWDKYLDTDPISVKTSLADSYDYKYDDSGKKLYEGKNIRIVAKGISADDSIFGPGLVLFIENTGKTSVTVQARDVSVNGFMIDPIFSSEIAAGKKTIDGLTFMSDDLDENSIDKITDAELSFHIFKTESWDTITDTKKYTLSFD